MHVVYHGVSHTATIRGSSALVPIGLNQYRAIELPELRPSKVIMHMTGVPIYVYPEYIMIGSIAKLDGIYLHSGAFEGITIIMLKWTPEGTDLVILATNGVNYCAREIEIDRPFAVDDRFGLSFENNTLSCKFTNGIMSVDFSLSEWDGKW